MSAPKIPISEKYWKNKGKKNKDVMIYTHDDLDGVYSAVAMKKYLISNGFNIIGYGIVNYQEEWKFTTIDTSVINIAVDFAVFNENLDVYIDHHGDFTEEDDDTITDTQSVKTQTDSAYEGIMDQLGLPVDSLVMDAIDMIDSAKYVDYGVEWVDILDFDLKEIVKKKNAKLVFASAFNQMIKRSDYKTIIEVIHNLDDLSIYKIYNLFKKIHPLNNKNYRSGEPKEFIEDGKWRLGEMKKRTRGSESVKTIYNSQNVFKSTQGKISNGIEYIKTNGYMVLGELVFVPTNTWANALRARSIIQQDINSGRLGAGSENIKWIMLQYNDTLQVISYDNINDYAKDILPINKDKTPIDNLDKFTSALLNNFQKHLGFVNDKACAGGHDGIGSISNIGDSIFNITDNKFYFNNTKYIDLFKNYIISSLSKLNWKLDLKWDYPTDERPYTPKMDMRKIMIDDIITF